MHVEDGDELGFGVGIILSYYREQHINAQHPISLIKQDLHFQLLHIHLQTEILFMFIEELNCFIIFSLLLEHFYVKLNYTLAH